MSKELRRKRKKQKYVHAIVCVLMVLWMIFGVIGMFTVAQMVWGKSLELSRETVKEEAVCDDSKKGQEENEAQKSSFTEAEKAACKEIYENNPDLLVLVNKEHELDVNYDPQLRSICKGRLETSDRMYQSLTEMLKAAGEAGYDYWIASAYRSRQRQQELIDEDVQALMQKEWSYENALEETLRETMPAGHSEHETGLALDILCSGNTDMDESQANEPGNQWLVANCADYGFILRYPKGKEAVTGIDYEPWHFRYVGREAAQYMTEHGVTLEEFWVLTTG